MSQQKISIARIYLLLVIMICASSVLGILLAAGKARKINLPVGGNPAVDLRCSQKIITNLICSGIGYGFDSDKGKCVVYSPYDDKKGCGANSVFNTLEECQKTCEVGYVEPVDKEITISTDKTEYEQGEEIKIAVNNGLDKSILYSGWGCRFWDIEYYKNGNWINPNDGFQLTEENIGNYCLIVLYERTSPEEELLSQVNLTTEWNQKICPFETEDPDRLKIVRYIESGKYRLVFSYGFEIDSNDEFRISESKKVYSNEFTIK